MGVSSYLEFLTVLFGWVMYDRLWAVLNDTGIVYLPFLVILLNSIIDSRKGGDDEGSAAIQSLKKCETDIVVGMVVLFLAAVPFTEVQLGEMTYVRPTLDCAVERRINAGTEPAEVDGTATGTEYDAALATIGGEVGRIPIWWGMVHVVSKAVVGGSVAAIPCTNNVASVSMRLGDDTIDEPELLHELADFRLDCHQPALACLAQNCRTGRQTDAAPTKDYIGSEWFLTQPGYYDRLQSRKARPAWSLNADRDRDLGGGAHPRCNEWWRDGTNGLRGRLLASIEIETRDELVYDAEAVLREENPSASTAELEDMLLRRYLAVSNGISSGGLSYEPSVGETFREQNSAVIGVMAAGMDVVEDVLSTTMAAAGLLLKAPGAAAEGMAIREGMPIFLSLLLMIFVIVLPFLMVFSRYDPGILLTLTLVFFALQFVYVLWGVAFWVDQHLYGALTGERGSPKANALQLGVMIWIQRLLYLVFPMVWVAALGWIGVRASDAFTHGVASPTKDVGAATRSGGDAAAGVAKGVATKGMKG